MNEEQVRGIEEQLENGVKVNCKYPDYFNAVVGDKHVGYIISLNNSEGKQINIILKTRNDKVLFEQPTIIMTIHSIFRYTSKGDKNYIESALIGREVILTPKAKSDKINHHYFLTGILNLKKEPP